MGRHTCSNTATGSQLLPPLFPLQGPSEPTQNVFDFTAADQIVNIAKANGHIIRGHNLGTWHQCPLMNPHLLIPPQFGTNSSRIGTQLFLFSRHFSHLYVLPRVTSGTWTNATLTAAMQNHITKLVSRYKGQFYAWGKKSVPLGFIPGLPCSQTLLMSPSMTTVGLDHNFHLFLVKI